MGGHAARASRRQRQCNHEGGRPVRVYVRLSEMEHAKLVVAAGRLGVSVPRYLVQAAIEMGDEDKSVAVGGGLFARRDLVEELRQVRRVLTLLGNNVNQIARGVNIEQVAPDETAYALNAATRVVERLDAVVEALQVD